MYEQTRLDRLEAMAGYAEAAPEERFDMKHWWCGTAGCLVGTYCRAEEGCGLELVHVGKQLWAVPSDDLCLHFGLVRNVSRFLFGGLDETSTQFATSLTQQEAIARLRKTIRYLRRKRDLWRDHEDLMAMSKKDRRERLLAPILT